MSKEPSYISIPGDQMPVELMKEFPSSSVTLVGLQNNNDPAHCGSGTLVKLENQYFILTAAPCARALANRGEIGLPIRRDKYPFRVPVIDPIFIGEPESDEWGPDLAFLPIPQVMARDIISISNHMFYDLGKYRNEMLSSELRAGYGLWVVIGAPASTSSLEDPTKLEFTKMTYAGGAFDSITRGAFDYLELRADIDRKEVPPNFKGVSGGGVWHTEVGRRQDGTFVALGKPKLEGCAFYETQPQGKYVYIRCHGRRSIYEHGISKLIEMKKIGQEL
jgi:hypothetical protein